MATIPTVTRPRALDAQFRAISTVFRVQTDLPEACRVIPKLLAPFVIGSTPPGTPQRSYRLTREQGEDNPFVVLVDDVPAYRSATALGTVDNLFWDINREAIGLVSDRLAIHASAASRDGVAVVLPARQDSGKSTLVAGLLGAGFSYCTDEASLLDLENAELHPYPKPLWLSPPSVRVIEGLRDRVLPEYRDLDRIRIYVRPGDLEAVEETRACAVGLVVSPRFQRGGTTALEPLSRAATLMCLAENSFNLRELGSGGLEPLRQLAINARGFRLSFSRLDEAVEVVSDLMSREIA